MAKRARPKLVKPPYVRTRSLNQTHVFSTVTNNKVVTLATGAEVVYSNNVITSILAPDSARMTDIVTPGFKKIQANGGIVNNPMTKVDTYYESSTGSIVGTNTSGTEKQYYSRVGSLGPILFGLQGAPTPEFSPENLQNYVSTKALAGMKPSGFMGLVALAEGKKTIGMLAKPLASVATLVAYIAQLRRGNMNIAIISKGNTLVVNGKKFLRPGAFRTQGPGKLIKSPNTSIVIPAGQAISGSVLAINLGFRPFLMDVEALLKGIPNLHTEPRLTSRASASDTKTTVVSSTSTWSIFSIPIKLTTVTTIKCRATVLYEDVFSVSQDFGVSLHDIPSALWELITLSYLVDYIVNIGDYIAALEAMSARKVLASSLVTTIDTVVKRELLGTTVPSMPTWVISQAASGTDSVRVVTKTRNDRVNTPTLSVKPLGKILRPAVLQNSLSLIVQSLATFGGRKKGLHF